MIQQMAEILCFHDYMAGRQSNPSAFIFVYFSCLYWYFSQLRNSNLGFETCDTTMLHTTLHIGSVDQHMNYSGCIVREFIPMVLPR